MADKPSHGVHALEKRPEPGSVPLVEEPIDPFYPFVNTFICIVYVKGDELRFRCGKTQSPGQQETKSIPHQGGVPELGVQKHMASEAKSVLLQGNVVTFLIQQEACSSPQGKCSLGKERIVVAELSGDLDPLVGMLQHAGQHHRVHGNGIIRECSKQ